MPIGPEQLSSGQLVVTSGFAIVRGDPFPASASRMPAMLGSGQADGWFEDTSYDRNRGDELKCCDFADHLDRGCTGGGLPSERARDRLPVPRFSRRVFNQLKLKERGTR